MAFFAAIVVFGLWRGDTDPAIGPIDIRPFQLQRFGRATEPAVTTQCEDRAPLGIGTGRQNLFRRFAGHKELPFLVAPHGRGHPVERVIALVQASALGRIEELAATTDVPADTGFHQTALDHVEAEVFGVGRRDRPELPRFTEVSDKPTTNLRPVQAAVWLIVMAACEECIDERTEGRAVGYPWLCEPDRHELRMDIGWEFRQPADDFVIKMSDRGLPDEVLNLILEPFRIARAHLAQPDRLPLSIASDEEDSAPASAVIAD